MRKEEFKKFFKSYSRNVDNTDRLYFWKLSDAIILEIIKRHIPKNLSKNDVILDAGGGTGKWICNFLSKIYKCQFILYDLSEDMTRQAKKSIAKRRLKNRVMIIKGNLEAIREIKDNSIDYIISIYNPVSFVNDKKKTLLEMFRVLKKNGRILIMGQGYYNAIASKINNFITSVEEIKEIEENYKVKWRIDIPELNVFSKKSFEFLLKSSGFKITQTYGIPIFVQPGPEDFDPKNIKKSRISKALENSQFFKEIFELEMKYNNKPTLVNRGMNLLVVGQK